MRNKMKYYLLLMTFILLACSTKVPNDQDKSVLKEAQTHFKVLQPSPIDPDKSENLIELGEKLYFEKKLSLDGNISCNSCHKLKKFGVDNEDLSSGQNSKRLSRNTPTVYNSSLNFKQSWDGRAKDIKEQIKLHLFDPLIYGMTDEKEILETLNKNKYPSLFKEASLNLSIPNALHALESFLQTLVTRSRFDDYLEGDIFALNASERRGLNKFIEIGCINCHAGENLGSMSFEKLGQAKKYKTNDQGRFLITQNNEDKMNFKVPSLRNVAQTAPYLHDGSIRTLEEMIDIMGEYQLGQKLLREDIQDIKAFLSTLDANSLPY